MRTSTKGFALVAIIIGVVIVLVTAGGGYWWWQNNTKVAVSVINQQATSQGEIASWKTYTSQYGFEIKYPSNWKIETGNTPSLSREGGAISGYNYITLTDSGASTEDLFELAILVDELPVDKTLQQYLDIVDGLQKYGKENEPERLVLDSQNISLDGQPAIRRIEWNNGGGFKQFVTYTKRKKAFYSIQQDYASRPRPQSYSQEALKNQRMEEYKPIYDALLSTFKFINNPSSCANVIDGARSRAKCYYDFAIINNDYSSCSPILKTKGSDYENYYVPDWQGGIMQQYGKCVLNFPAKQYDANACNNLFAKSLTGEIYNCLNKENINRQDPNGNTILMYYVVSSGAGYYDYWTEPQNSLYPKIFSYKPDVNIQNNNGEAVLHLWLRAYLKSITGSTNLLKTILANGAKIDIQDKSGLTPKKILDQSSQSSSFKDDIRKIIFPK